MAWIDSYRPASFRGVPFFVEGHDTEVGRRQVTHEFPQRDTPYTEDLGRKARRYSVEAYLVGDDYPAMRDRLLAAAETAGAGELVHPYLGNMQAVCEVVRLRETSAELRMCRLQLSFVEAGEPAFPGIAADPVSAVSSAASSVASAAEGGFLQRYSVDGFSSFVARSAADKLSGFSSILQGLPIGALADPQAVASFVSRVRAIADDAISLATKPANIVAELSASIGSIRSIFGGGASGALATIRAAYSAPFSGLGTTINRRQQQANEDSFSALVRRLVVIEEARIAVVDAQPAQPGAPAITYPTRDQAIAVREQITAAIDIELEDPATTPDEYQSLAQLRAQVVATIPGDQLKLPRIAQFTPRATVPSLVIAYDLYLDAGRSVEIAERNRIRHPGFVPGREPLQVVTDG